MSSVSAYFDRLLDRRGEPALPALHSTTYRDGSAPLPARCHDNVDRWVSENPEAVAVRGWAIEMDRSDSVMLVAHSVVRLSGGELAEITLDRAYPFLSHEGTAEDFEYLRTNFAQLIWPPAKGVELGS